jgi:hypothetical protein
MRWLLALLLIGAAEPEPSVTLSADSEGRWVPFELTPGNQIRFTAEVDGKPVAAILDTGVSHSLLSRAVADPARVRAGGQGEAVGGTVALGWVATARVAFGGLTRGGGGLSVAALPGTATGGGERIEMLVGRDLLEDVALDIDFAARRFRLLRSGRLPFAGDVAPLSVSGARQVYESELMLDGRRIAPVIVDTGDGAAVTLADAVWRAALPAGLPTTDALAFGLAGPVVSALAIAPALELGQLAVRDVEVRIEPAGGFADRTGTAGRIGTGLLGHYRVLLDPGAGRMVLSAQAGAGRPPLRSTSGLLLAVRPDRLEVLHVMRGGPAAAVGWRAGDLICSVDGIAIDAGYAGSALAGWSVAAVGRAVGLGLCDGTQRTLVLRHFY